MHWSLVWLGYFLTWATIPHILLRNKPPTSRGCFGGELVAIERLMGMVLTAIATKMMLTGIRAFFAL